MTRNGSIWQLNTLPFYPFPKQCITSYLNWERKIFMSANHSLMQHALQ